MREQLRLFLSFVPPTFCLFSPLFSFFHQKFLLSELLFFNEKKTAKGQLKSIPSCQFPAGLILEAHKFYIGIRRCVANLVWNFSFPFNRDDLCGKIHIALVHARSTFDLLSSELKKFKDQFQTFILNFV